MSHTEAYNHLHLCDCCDHAEHVAHDWHESGCAYRVWYVSRQHERTDEQAERGKRVGWWKQ